MAPSGEKKTSNNRHRFPETKSNVLEISWFHARMLVPLKKKYEIELKTITKDEVKKISAAIRVQHFFPNRLTSTNGTSIEQSICFRIYGATELFIARPITLQSSLSGVRAIYTAFMFTNRRRVRFNDKSRLYFRSCFLPQSHDFIYWPLDCVGVDGWRVLWYDASSTE